MFSRLAINDDRGEKVARMQSRQALQEIHLNEIRAAAVGGSPMRKINRTNNGYARAASESPRTPRSQQPVAEVRRRGDREKGGNNSPGELNVVGGSAVTPMKRVPILANFEEWMKMATDNKINPANSWNFALIDYFHDMSLLKEGDGVNFQKASCTLDGCVKIYTSRVDSVATETGRLLSGLADTADGKRKKTREDGDEDEDGEGEEEEEDGEDGGSRKKTKKKPARSHEATLAPSFASLQLKKLELEFAVDPLFKKASADFDEGGAKGLLLNHLSIDSDGRIVFDSSDDAGDAALASEPTQAPQTEEQDVYPKSDDQTECADADKDIDLSSLAVKFFPDLSVLESQDICPSMKNFTLGDPSGDLTIPFLKAPEDWRDVHNDKKEESIPLPPLDPNFRLGDQTGIFLDGSNALGFDDDDDDASGNAGHHQLGGLDIPEDVGFGEGGEAWARDAALEPMMRVARAEDGNGSLDDNLIEGHSTDEYALSLQHKYQEDAEHESIMAYFDKAFNSRGKRKNVFMTLENWRIQKIQKARQSEAGPPTRQRKEREPFEIDFRSPMSESLKELLEAPAVSNSTISLPKAQWRTKGRNLLDKDDEVVDARKLMRLWVKPKCRIGRRRGEMRVIDEGCGARGPVGADRDEEEDEDAGRNGDYDANFFADDEPILPFDVPLPIDDDDDDNDNDHDNDDEGAPQGFMDAREMLSPQPETQPPQGPPFLHDDGVAPFDNADPRESQPAGPQDPRPHQNEMLPGSFGSQLVTQAGRRMRPEYVNYARTAKKVDVRRLKENMWKGMSEKLIQSLQMPDGHQPQQHPASSPPELEPDGDADVDMMDVDGPDEAGPTTPPPPPLPAGTELKFTDMIGDLRKIYPDQQMKDISTSYCFICLLHLANEKGLVLEGQRDGEGAMQEIRVRKDETVGEGYEGE